MKILIVENDPMVRGIVGMVVAEMGGPTILLARNGKEAFALLQREAVDLVISSWSGTGMGGVELLSLCRQDPGLKNVPFVAMGSRRDLEAKAMEAGAGAYLAKPFSAEELLEVLRRLVPSVLRPSRAEPDDAESK